LIPNNAPKITLKLGESTAIGVNHFYMNTKANMCDAETLIQSFLEIRDRRILAEEALDIFKTELFAAFLR
jgi:hypothetical protein